jgi:hypothetical protein
VSTESQDPEVQLVALRAHAAQRDWQVVEEFVDRGVSGAKERRRALDRLMKAAWAGQFQVVLVWRFDRFARSVKHLVGALETFRSLHVGFVSLQEQLDTATPIGQAMFVIIGAMAQLERDRLVPRVLRLDDTPHGTLTTLPTTLPTALARGLLAPRRSTVTSNSSHHAVQLRVTLDRRSVLEPSSA